MLGAAGQGHGPDRMREIDLAGDTLRETNVDALNAELAAMGQPSITNFNHEALPLPNGDIAVLAGTSRTIDVNGTPTNYNGDMVLVLDQDLQVTWVWNAFDWLDTSRLGTDGEGRVTGCTPTPSPGRPRTGTYWSPSAPRTG